MQGNNFDSDDLNDLRGKMIGVIMTGSHAVNYGKLVFVGAGYFILSDKVTSKRRMKTSDLQSFWCEDDEPDEG